MWVDGLSLVMLARVWNSKRYAHDELGHWVIFVGATCLWHLILAIAGIVIIGTIPRTQLRQIRAEGWGHADDLVFKILIRITLSVAEFVKNYGHACIIEPQSVFVTQLRIQARKQGKTCPGWHIKAWTFLIGNTIWSRYCTPWEWSGFWNMAKSAMWCASTATIPLL